MDAPGHRTPAVKTFEGEKTEEELTGNKSIIFISKWLFDIKVKGFQGKFWAAM